MNRKIRYGLAGYGKVAHLHAQGLKESDHGVLVSVTGRNTQRRDSFAAQWNIASRGSIEEMVRLDQVDAVIVVTPHPRHRDDSLEAFAAGAHVIVEKPMALTVAQCDEMVASAASARRKLSVVSQRRWYPSSRRIRDAIDAGKIGKPSVAQVTLLGWRDQEYYKSDPWRGKWSTEGGGVLINQAPHQIDLMNWFMGPTAEIKAYWGNVNHPYIEVEDTAVASVLFKNGGMGSILASNSQKPGIHAKVHIHGDTGYSAGVQTDGGAMFVAGMSGIQEPPYNDLWTIPGEEDSLASWKTEDAEFFGTIDPTVYFFTRQLDDFSTAIMDDRQPAVTGEDGRETVRVIENIYRYGKQA